jgi:lipoate-protein ligase A
MAGKTVDIRIDAPLVLVGRSPSCSGTYSMALDEHLFESAVRFGRHVWRLYRWDPPAVSIGRNQRVREAVNQQVMREQKITMVRRPTGGRAIWHHGDVCFTHAGVTPGEVESVSSFKGDYMRAADVVVGFLDALGIEAEISGGHKGQKTPGGTFKAPCFQSPGRFEITVGGKKIAGIAQYRAGERFLIQGSIRLSGMDRRCRSLFFGDDDDARVAYGRFVASVTSIEDELRRSVNWNRLMETFSTVSGGESACVVDPDDAKSDIDLAEVQALEKKKYRNSRWNRRL